MKVSMTLPQYRRRECSIVHPLPEQQLELLTLLLVSAPDRFVPRDTLIERLWSHAREPDDARGCIETYIHRLREIGVYVENDWGNGWRIPQEGRA
jgi:DNA-binding response OmpR family regulator